MAWMRGCISLPRRARRARIMSWGPIQAVRTASTTASAMPAMPIAGQMPMDSVWSSSSTGAICSPMVRNTNPSSRSWMLSQVTPEVTRCSGGSSRDRENR